MNSHPHVGPRQTDRRGVVAVIVRQGRLLVIRRSSHVVAPRKYCFPGGAIEDAETEPAALVRELREELGVTVLPVRPIWHSVTPWRVRLSWWLAELPPGETLAPSAAEVESLLWCTADEMAALADLLESNRHFLDALRRGEIDLAV